MIDTSEILVSKEHVDPLRDQGYVIYKLGRITPVAEGKREAKMLWGNVKGSIPQIRSDWNATTGVAVIDNKPTTFTPSSHLHPISDVTGLDTALLNKLETSLKGSVNGLAELDSNGFVLNTQLPSYVDDVLEFTNFAALPLIGESGKIYIAKDANVTYRWSGTSYAEISASLALGETSATAYRGDRGKTAYDYSQIGHEPAFAKNTAFNKNFGTTSGTVLEGRTFGTAANSAATDFAPASGSSNYQAIINAGTTSQYWRGDKTWQTFPTIPTTTSQLINDSGFVTSIGTFAPISGSANYIQNQNASAQNANAWISGNFTTPKLTLNQVDAPNTYVNTALNGAGLLNGNYTYVTTYYTALGETDLLGGSSPYILATNNKINLTNIPISTDGRVIGRRIYRNKATDDDVLKRLVVDIPNNTTTSYTDNIPDASLGAFANRGNTTGGILFINYQPVIRANSASLLIGLNNTSANLGYANTLIGSLIAPNATTMYRSTAVGLSSLYSNITGNNITALGVHAGQSTNADGGVFIGYGAGFHETGANKLFIDNTPRLDELSARNSALLYGQFNSDAALQVLRINAKTEIFSPTGDYSRLVFSANGNLSYIRTTDGNLMFDFINTSTIDVGDDDAVSGIRFFTNNDVSTPKMIIKRSGQVKIPNLSGTNTRLSIATSDGTLSTIVDGTNGQILQTDGNGLYSFVSAMNTSYMSSNYIPKWDGTKLINSQVWQNTTSLYNEVASGNNSRITFKSGNHAAYINAFDGNLNFDFVNTMTYDGNDATLSGIRFFTNNDTTTPKLQIKRLGDVVFAGAISGTSASFSGNTTASTFTLGSSLWTIDVAAGKLVFKYNGTALMSLDASGNIKAAAEIYRGGL